MLYYYKIRHELVLKCGEFLTYVSSFHLVTSSQREGSHHVWGSRHILPEGNLSIFDAKNQIYGTLM